MASEAVDVEDGMTSASQGEGQLLGTLDPEVPGHCRQNDDGRGEARR